MPPIRDLATLLATLSPLLHEGTFVFATLGTDQPLAMTEIVALIREPEGVSVVVTADTATRTGLQPLLHCAWITLSVNSDLEAVGLTAAVATALSEAGIPCNVVAGAQHDHLFVPVHLAQAAMDALQALQRSGRTPGRT